MPHRIQSRSSAFSRAVNFSPLPSGGMMFIVTFAHSLLSRSGPTRVRSEPTRYHHCESGQQAEV